MLMIRNDQEKAFRDAALLTFENEMVVHLAEFSPPLFNAVKENQMRMVIRFGLERARRYGIDFRGPVRLYLELMLLFGSYFDTDPQYPWASQILNDQGSAGQMQRAESLLKKTRDYRENVGGSQDQHTLKALRNIRHMAQQPMPEPLGDIRSEMLVQMNHAYPQKTTYVGETALNALIDQGITSAKGYGFEADRELALVVVLMFAFGHGCLDDPLYPWIANTVTKETIIDPSDRAARLEKKAMIWLDHVLSYFY